MTTPLITAGRPAFGLLPTPPSRVNFLDYDYRSPMGKPRAAWRKKWAFHQFQYFGVISETLIGGCALADLRWATVGFFYLYHPQTGQQIEKRIKLPLGMASRFSKVPDNGVCEIAVGGVRMRLENSAEGRRKRLLVELADGTRMDAWFSEQDADFEPMCICTRAAVNGWVYAQKVAGVRCEGQVSSPLGDFDLAAIGAYAHHDWSAGFMRRETWWNWACTSGVADGVAVGFNLSCGVNETSVTENCYWLDGKLHKVDGCFFDFDQDQPLKPWRVFSQDGQVELTFTPEGLHGEQMNALIVASRFKQIFGRFEGVLRPTGQAPVTLTNFWGFVEDQYAKW